MTPRRTLAAGGLLLAATLAATWAGLRPPAARPASAPAGAFSAERALARLRDVLGAAGDGVPHPAGSAANVRVRERVVAELRALGLSPRVEESFTCGRYLDCTPVGNVVARVPGRGAGAPVLVSVHHDSVPAGPGAADDGSGVAVVLEMARALLAEPAAADVVLLVDDAEESGLGGAAAFLGDPWAREAGALVNLEARGTAGPSILFETAGDGAVVARRLAERAPHPVGSSLFSAVYRLIPNDTDLTVLRRLGVPSANLAFIEGATRYHTPRDDLAHLDPRTVQHHGDTALALVRGLAEPAPDTRGEAVWFDVLGRAVVRYPEAAALPLGAIALLLALLAAGADVRRGRARAGRVALGILGAPVALVTAAALGFAAGRALGLDPILRPWVASPAPLVAAFLLAGLAGAALAGVLPGAAAGAAGLRGGVRIALAGLAVALAMLLPGASYLPLVPALAGSLVGLVAARRGEEAAPWADLAALAAGAVVLLPPVWLFYPALGHSAGAPAAAFAALVALPLAPAIAGLSRRGRALAVLLPAGAWASAVAVAVVLPKADVDHPEHVVVYFHQDAATGKARVLASPDLGRLPDGVRATAPFSTSAEVRFGWGGLRPAFAAAVPPVPDPGPEVEDLRVAWTGPSVRVAFRLRSPRGAPELQVAIPPSVTIRAFSFDGLPVPAPAPKLSRWYGGWGVHRVPSRPGGVEVAFTADAPSAFEIVVADASGDLPPAAAAVAAARPPWAVTQQEGDVFLYTRPVPIEPAGASSPRRRPRAGPRRRPVRPYIRPQGRRNGQRRQAERSSIWGNRSLDAALRRGSSSRSFIAAMLSRMRACAASSAGASTATSTRSAPAPRYTSPPTTDSGGACHLRCA